MQNRKVNEIISSPFQFICLRIKTMLLLMSGVMVLFFIPLSSCKKDDQKKDTNETNWVLTFQDDFLDFDPSNWKIHNWNLHCNKAITNPSAVTIQQGNLIITAGMIDGILVSGGLSHTFDLKYGKFEFRVRTERDSNAATSGVIYTYPENGSPIEEVSIYETGINADRNSFQTIIHYPPAGSGLQFDYTHQANASEWHIIAMERTQNFIKIYRDNELVWSMTDLMGIPREPHHLCIELDAFKTTMTGTVKMYVDWVKIYVLDTRK